jgi:hypothetical protein
MESLGYILNPLYFKFYLELYGILALILSFLAPIIVSRIYFGSFRYGILIFLLNFALALIRTKAAIAALLKANPGYKWIKGSEEKYGKFISALKNSMAEVMFSLSLFGLGIFAFLTNNFFWWRLACMVLYII